MQQVKIK